jgi:hypothetical protein
MLYRHKTFGMLPIFDTMNGVEDFDRFIAENDALAVKAALDENMFSGEAKQAAVLFLIRHEHAAAEAASSAARSAQERATRAAERSARWTMIAAIASAIGALAAAGAVLLPLMVR